MESGQANNNGISDRRENNANPRTVSKVENLTESCVIINSVCNEISDIFNLNNLTKKKMFLVPRIALEVLGNSHSSIHINTRIKFLHIVLEFAFYLYLKDILNPHYHEFLEEVFDSNHRFYCENTYKVNWESFHYDIIELVHPSCTVITNTETLNDSLINHWYCIGGFEKFFYSDASELDLDVIITIITLFANCIKSIKTDYGRNYKFIFEKWLKGTYKLSDKKLRLAKRDDLERLLYFVERNECALNTDPIKFQYSLGLRCISCNILEKRLYGLRKLQYLLISSNGEYAHSLIRKLHEDDVLKLIFNSSSHEQLIQDSLDMVSCFLKYECFTVDDFDIIWKASKNSHESVKIKIYLIIVQIYHFFDESLYNHFLRTIKSEKLNEDIMKLIYECAIESQRNIDLTNILWDVSHDTSSNLMSTASEYLKMILRDDRSESSRCYFLKIIIGRLHFNTPKNGFYIELLHIIINKCFAMSQMQEIDNNLFSQKNDSCRGILENYERIIDILLKEDSDFSSSYSSLNNYHSAKYNYEIEARLNLFHSISLYFEIDNFRYYESIWKIHCEDTCNQNERIRCFEFFKRFNLISSKKERFIFKTYFDIFEQCILKMPLEWIDEAGFDCFNYYFMQLYNYRNIYHRYNNFRDCREIDQKYARCLNAGKKFLWDIALYAKTSEVAEKAQKGLCDYQIDSESSESKIYDFISICLEEIRQINDQHLSINQKIGSNKQNFVDNLDNSLNAKEYQNNNNNNNDHTIIIYRCFNILLSILEKFESYDPFLTSTYSINIPVEIIVESPLIYLDSKKFKQSPALTRYAKSMIEISCDAYLPLSILMRTIAHEIRKIFPKLDFSDSELFFYRIYPQFKYFDHNESGSTLAQLNISDNNKFIARIYSQANNFYTKLHPTRKKVNINSRIRSLIQYENYPEELIEYFIKNQTFNIELVLFDKKYNSQILKQAEKSQGIKFDSNSMKRIKSRSDRLQSIHRWMFNIYNIEDRENVSFIFIKHPSTLDLFFSVLDTYPQKEDILSVVWELIDRIPPFKNICEELIHDQNPDWNSLLIPNETSFFYKLRIIEYILFPFADNYFVDKRIEWSLRFIENKGLKVLVDFISAYNFNDLISKQENLRITRKREFMLKIFRIISILLHRHPMDTIDSEVVFPTENNERGYDNSFVKIWDSLNKLESFDRNVPHPEILLKKLNEILSYTCKYCNDSWLIFTRNCWMLVRTIWNIISEKSGTMKNGESSINTGGCTNSNSINSKNKLIFEIESDLNSDKWVGLIFDCLRNPYISLVTAQEIYKLVKFNRRALFSILKFFLSKSLPMDPKNLDFFWFIEKALSEFKLLADRKSDNSKDPALMQIENQIIEFSKLVIGIICDSVSGKSKYVEKEIYLSGLFRIASILFSFNGVRVPPVEVLSFIWNEYLFRPKSNESDFPRFKCYNSRWEAFNFLRKLKLPSESFQLIAKLFYRTGDELDFKNPNWNFENQEKSRVGFIGLNNLGATCYINSLIQQLFMMPKFRRQILRSPLNLNTRAVHENCLYQLQCLFARLQNSHRPFVNTKKFLNSCTDIDGEIPNTHQQQDVQEFFATFLNNLEIQLKGTPYENLLNITFGCYCVNTYTSMEAEYPHKSSREEYFPMIPVEVKNKTELEHSLDSFIEPEVLEGENKYYSERHNRSITASKRTSIRRMNNTIIFHLKRFTYNVNSDSKIKIVDYFKFPRVLHMKRWTQNGLAHELNHPEEDEGLPDSYYQYKLTGILIHAGTTADSGHYYSIIQERDPPYKWIQFNDKMVLEFDFQYFESECYGGTKIERGKESPVDRSAYILFYDRIKPLTDEELINPLLLKKGFSIPLNSLEPHSMGCPADICNQHSNLIGQESILNQTNDLKSNLIEINGKAKIEMKNSNDSNENQQSNNESNQKFSKVNNPLDLNITDKKQTKIECMDSLDNRDEIEGDEFINNIPKMIYNQVYQENVEFLRERHLCESQYFSYIWDLLENYPELSFDPPQNWNNSVESFFMDRPLNTIEYNDDNSNDLRISDENDLKNNVLIYVFKLTLDIISSAQDPNLSLFIYWIIHQIRASDKAAFFLLEYIYNHKSIKAPLLKCSVESNRILFSYLFSNLAYSIYEIGLFSQPKNSLDLLESFLNKIVFFEESRSYWKNFKQYFALIRNIALFDESVRIMMIKKKFITIYQEYFMIRNGKKSNGNVIPAIMDESNQPDLTEFVDTISILLRTCNFFKFIPSTPLSLGGFKFFEGLDSAISFVLSSVNLTYNPFAIGDILEHLSWNNHKFSEKIIIGILRNYEDEFKFEVMEVLQSRLICIEDSLQERRIMIILGMQNDIPSIMNNIIHLKDSAFREVLRYIIVYLRLLEAHPKAKQFVLNNNNDHLRLIEGVLMNIVRIEAEILDLPNDSILDDLRNDSYLYEYFLPQANKLFPAYSSEFNEAIVYPNSAPTDFHLNLNFCDNNPYNQNVSICDLGNDINMSILISKRLLSYLALIHVLHLLEIKNRSANSSTLSKKDHFNVDSKIKNNNNSSKADPLNDRDMDNNLSKFLETKDINMGDDYY